MGGELQPIEPDSVEQPLEAPRPRAITRRQGSLPEVRVAGAAAAGGVVVGAAAAVMFARAYSKRKHLPARKGWLRRRDERPMQVALSRSFLIDVHMLSK